MFLLSLFGVILAFVASIVRFRRSRYYQLLKVIPGPRRLPVVGGAIDVFKNTDRVLDYARRLHLKYGNVFAVWVGRYCSVLLSDPRDIEIVLNKTATLSKPPPYKVLELYMGHSLLTANATVWKKFHRLITPAFGIPTLKSFLPAFNEKSKLLVDLLRNHASGESFDIMDHVMMCTLDMVTQTSLGTNMNVLQNGRVELVKSLCVAEDVIFYGMFRPWCWIHTLMKRTPTYRAMVDGVKALWDYADEIIEHKLRVSVAENDTRHLVQEVEEESNGPFIPEKKHLGFLEHVISCMKSESTALTKVEIKDNTMTLFVGAMGTASITISAALMLLGLHQDVQRRVAEELDQIFGDEIHRSLILDDLTQMVYLEQVINETLRLYPPIPLVARKVENEVKITDYVLPTGAYVIVPVYIVHRNPEYFPDPYKFDPDRFSPENRINRHPYSFIPFLGGRRMCIGKKYAYMQMKTILSTILRNYEVLPCGSREEMEYVECKVTLHMVNGHNVRLVSRRSDFLH